jgi:hypothetical protein
MRCVSRTKIVYPEDEPHKKKEKQPSRLNDQDSKKWSFPAPPPSLHFSFNYPTDHLHEDDYEDD